ncbi:MAG TPA: hypothetical protein PLD74_01920 [Prolixibacteraceae bacterium]|nr:hypothetical protein [Prolixibacteraceae bacterium]HOR99335.1 hypothetical protein [Prolixibacteraceae bacterium]HOS90707.1 hypothetical protein [Prolixibacteraceae bacterium]HPL44477.1 hypothetical protein [Prolixibacteraceae bacterium]HPV18028.1 hypothetical protein [Prolixibacteraceae bacterium]
MVCLRKVFATFFAALILIFSATCQIPATYEVSPGSWDHSGELAWVLPAAHPGYLVQEGATTQGSPVWRSEISIPGLFFRNQATKEPPRMQLLRKFYVADTFTYSPCKSVILYPFHEFS